MSRVLRPRRQGRPHHRWQRRNRQRHRARAAEAACPGRHRRPRPDDTAAGRRAATPTNALGCVADVRDRASLDEAVAQTVDRFGRLDVVIANAGLLAKAATLRNTPIADIEATLAVNVTGVANTVAAGLDAGDRQQGPGRADQLGLRLPQRHGHDPLRHEQGGRRAARARAARRTRRPRCLGPHGVLLARPDRHDRPRRRRGPGRHGAARHAAQGHVEADHPGTGRGRHRRRARDPRSPGHPAEPVAPCLVPARPPRPHARQPLHPGPPHPRRPRPPRCPPLRISQSPPPQHPHEGSKS